MSETANHTVLILERDPETTDLLIDLLVGDGLAIEVAICGQTALDRLSRAKLDLVLADFELTDMAGLDFLAQAGEVPVIFSAPEARRDEMIDALEQGAVDFVLRPFLQRELLARVRRHLALADCARAVRQAADAATAD